MNMIPVIIDRIIVVLLIMFRSLVGLLIMSLPKKLTKKDKKVKINHN